MAYFLFIDESGHDQRESPYEVLAGVSVRDLDLWNLICAIHDTQIRCFGKMRSGFQDELKAKKLLKTKTFRLAAQLPAFPHERRAELAREVLEDGAQPTRERLTALGQAKLAYVQEVLDLCGRYRCRVFASMVPRGAPRTNAGDYLRKDYSFLLERFFYFLEDSGVEDAGVVVFDERDRTESHILVAQMDRYFRRTAKGRQRAGQIVPEPMFVHSDLTTGIHLADLAAYILAWGFRTPGMSAPDRLELAPFAQQIARTRYRTLREIDGNPSFVVWSVALIDDLRANES
jgi:hypothetical protein